MVSRVLGRRVMSRPEDPLGGKSHLASQSPGQMSDQARPEEIERHRAADAQAMPSAQARIENAINDIRSRGDRPPSVRLPKLPPTANLRLPQQAANRPSASSRGDPFARIESRPRSSLDPEIMPAPPEGSRRLGPILIRSILMVGFAAIVAYGITVLSFFQLDSRGPKSSSNGDTMSHEPTSGVRHRLVVEDQQAFANEPILLAVVAVPTTSSGSLLLRGLAHGTRLSAGAALDEDGWELSLRDIGSAYVYAPPDFVGAMNATIALLSPSKKVIDSRPIRLEWTAKVDSLQPPTNNREIDPKIANAATKQEINPGTASAAARQEINPGASAAAVKPIDPQEAAALMERGRDLLRNGDVASAQLVFRRLAEAGKADAALALATTYDPRYLVEHNLVGIVGDEAKARAWYRRAKELGSMEADRFLQPTNTK
jgi:hypothetical protein